MLFENWPQFFDVQEDAVLPAEDLVRIKRGSNNGWPYCFFDAVFEHKKLLAPEYGGDGHLASGANGIDCAKSNQPLVTFGAHWAPNGLHFYTGKQFPDHYRNGAFVAFHGGFVGTTEEFANGFAGTAANLPGAALHRPVGVTDGPDGSLFISDDRGGRIYRVLYVGNRGS